MDWDKVEDIIKKVVRAEISALRKYEVDDIVESIIRQLKEQCKECLKSQIDLWGN